MLTTRYFTNSTATSQIVLVKNSINRESYGWRMSTALPRHIERERERERERWRERERKRERLTNTLFRGWVWKNVSLITQSNWKQVDSCLFLIAKKNSGVFSKSVVVVVALYPEKISQIQHKQKNVKKISRCGWVLFAADTPRMAFRKKDFYYLFNEAKQDATTDGRIKIAKNWKAFVPTKPATKTMKPQSTVLPWKSITLHPLSIQGWKKPKNISWEICQKSTKKDLVGEFFLCFYLFCLLPFKV